MPLRFQKRIRIVKGLTLNIGKTGTSFTIGGRVASVNIKGDRVTGKVGIPGTGLSYRQRLDQPNHARAVEPPPPITPPRPAQRHNSHFFIGLFIALVLMHWFLP